MKKCKWCQCITCNKKATNWTDKTISLRNGETQILGFCYGHYEMIVTKTLANSDQLTVGEIILKLEPIVEKQKQRIKNGNEEAVVYYDFEYLYPTTIDSWRGIYAELALNFVADKYSEEKPLTVSKFLQLIKDCIGKEFTGYKGGEFIMSKHTPVWVANYGNSGNTAVIDIVDKDYEVLIITGYRES